MQIMLDNRQYAPLRLGVIGLGWAGRAQVDALNHIPEIELVAVADTAPVDLKLPEGCIFYQDWRELLRHPSVQAVSVCLPHFLHLECGEAVLAAGMPLLMEKPLALNVAQGRRLWETARARNLTLMVEMTHHFYPTIRAARAIVQGGQLGHIFAIEDRILEDVSGVYSGTWLLQRDKAGGGVALTNGIHMLDRLRWITGQSLRLLSASAGWQAALYDVEDTAVMHLALADGTPVQLLAAFQNGGSHLDDELTIYGSNGTLRVWTWRKWRLERADGRAQEGIGPPGEEVGASSPGQRFQEGMIGALREFAVAVRERRSPAVNTEEVLCAQELIEQFYARVMP